MNESVPYLDGDLFAPDNRDNVEAARKLLAEIRAQRKGKKFELIEVDNKTWIEKEIPCIQA